MCPSVSREEWLVNEELIGERKERLLTVPTAGKLLECITNEAHEAASTYEIQISLIQASDKPGYYRVEAKIPVSEILWDQFFNGRTGYRARYYISATQGSAFNRAIIEALTPSVLHACRNHTLRDDGDLIRKSLEGKYSKVWVVGDGQAFLDSLAALKIPRWVSYWRDRDRDSKLGLRVPLPSAPQLDLKGTFIKPETGEQWVDPIKFDRSDDIYSKGWT